MRRLCGRLSFVTVIIVSAFQPVFGFFFRRFSQDVVQRGVQPYGVFFTVFILARGYISQKRNQRIPAGIGKMLADDFRRLFGRVFALDGLDHVVESVGIVDFG